MYFLHVSLSLPHKHSDEFASLWTRTHQRTHTQTPQRTAAITRIHKHRYICEQTPTTYSCLLFEQEQEIFDKRYTMTFRNKVLPGGTNTSADRVYIRTFLPELSRTIKNDIYCAQTHTEIIASLPISCNDNVPYTVTRAQRHTGTETHRQNTEKRSFDSQTQGQFSFRE